MCLGNCHFVTDKNTFISEKSPTAISGYIIGVLKVQRFEKGEVLDAKQGDKKPMTADEVITPFNISNADPSGRRLLM
jgi:hypothetical protein